MTSHGLQHNHPHFDEGFQPSSPEPETCEACFWELRAREPWIRTFTGKFVNPLNLRPEDIDIRDIAHHLACTNRWAGALREPISVAQHSVHVMRLCRGTGFELEALLHDATEAYLGDVTKWLKSHDSMAFYREAERRAHRVICETFGMDPSRILPDVERADRMMINIEGSFGFPDWRSMPGFPVPTPADLERCRLYCSWDWHHAEMMFLDCFQFHADRR